MLGLTSESTPRQLKGISGSPLGSAAVATGLALGFVLLSACGGAQAVRERSYAERAEDAFAEAESALDDGNYPHALRLYTQVSDSYELSSYAVLAELRIGDVYFEQATYRQAAQAYRQFIQLHPAHAAVPYARFRIGMSYFEDMPSEFFLLPPAHERELGSTRAASQHLSGFLTEYEDTDDAETRRYVELATDAYQEALDRLAGYEFYLATFYLERERPTASASHLRTLLADYPRTSFEPEALFLLARCYVELQDVYSALEALQTLHGDYPEHPLTSRATDWMATHRLAFDELPQTTLPAE